MTYGCTDGNEVSAAFHSFRMLCVYMAYVVPLIRLYL